VYTPEEKGCRARKKKGGSGKTISSVTGVDSRRGGVSPLLRGKRRIFVGQRGEKGAPGKEKRLTGKG